MQTNTAALKTVLKRTNNKADSVAQFRAKYKALTANQICDDLQMSKATLWRMIKRGDFPQASFLAGTDRRWTLAALEAWHKEQAKKLAAK